MWKPFAIGFSLANLAYLRVWTELLSYTPAQTYEMRLPPLPNAYLAATLNVTAWGLVFGFLGLAARHSGARTRSLGEWAFLAVLLVPLNALRSVLASHLPFGQQYLKGGLYLALGPVGLAAVATAAMAGGAFALGRRRRHFTRAARALLLALFAFVPLTFVQAAAKIARYDATAFRDLPAARASAHGHPERRVVWILFDEWDQRLSFDKRRAGLDLPAFDRFRSQSFAAQNALPPAQSTIESLPSLITGRTVAAAVPTGPGSLSLRFAEGGESEWSETPNVFQRARALGFETALVGVYHPYCRVLGKALGSCWWQEMPRPINSTGATLAERMAGQTRSLFETWRLSLFGQSLSTQRKAIEFPEALARAGQAAADPTFGLVLLHLLTPHFPHCYDRKRADFSLGNAPLAGYYDSLALTDKSFAQLRSAMEAAGVWENTTLVLSSDHALKHAEALDGHSDPRVPFLVKLAGEKRALSYEREFNTVVTAELLLVVLRGEVATTSDLAGWLDGRSRPAGGEAR